jgi:non-ribosomal peptide synthase protein (TIGR01720 family)
MVARLGEMWVRGVDVKWGGMYAGEARRRVELPTYEFERERYWVEARTNGNQGEDKAAPGRAEIGKWLYVPVWKQSVGQRSDVAEASGQKWLVFREESGLSDQLVARLEAAGADVVSVRRGHEYECEEEKRYAIKGDSREEYERLVEELDERGWRAGRVIHLWSVTDGDEVSELESMQERGFFSLLFLAQALGKQVLSESFEEEKKTDRIRITVVSNNMQSVTGDEELQPEKATVLGPCRGIGQEYPHIDCQSVDVVLQGPRRQATIVKQLFAELLSESAERVVAYRGKYRWAQTYEHVKLERHTVHARLRQHGVYVITGGLGGVGLVLAEHLVEAAQAKLVLIGRSAFPGRSEWEHWLKSNEANDPVSAKIRKLQRLEERGGEVFVVQADVTDLEQMQNVWAQARLRFGPVHGVIHAAGIPPEGLIQLKSREKAAEVLSPKVRGTAVLDSLCRDDRLDFIVLCSSINSILALPGRTDYCAANAFLDAYAHSKNIEGGTYTVSINWGGWEEVGMGATSTLGSDVLNGEYSVEGMLSSEGVEVFDRILMGDLPQVVVSVVDLPARVRRHDAITAESSLEKLKHERTILPTHARPHLKNEYVAPRNEVEQIIAGIWQTLLGIDQIGVEDNFFELGGDSIQSIQIIARAGQAGVQLTPTQVFEHQTIAELAAVAGKGKTIAVEQGIVSGEAPLTPLQRWFFQQQPAEVNHYNQAVMFNLRQRLDAPIVKQVIARLSEHHDALRLRFDRTDGNWRQWHAAPEAGASEEIFKYIDLRAVPVAERATAITAAADEVQHSLNLAEGPVWRVALMDLGEDIEARLLIVIHHLVVDAVSWRILLEDLQRGYDQLRRGEAVNFLAKTTSYKNWAEALSKQSQTDEIRRELDYWLEVTSHAAAPLPVDDEQGLNTMEFQRIVDVKLDAELTRQLLQDVPSTFNTQINEVLLTALVSAFERWSGSNSLMVNVEGHGREEIVEGIDVSRTVGWFTTIYPLLLEVEAEEDLGQTLARTKERLQAVPRRGIGFGMLKYLNADPSIFNQLRKTVNPQVSFLYLGQLDQPLAQLELFTEAEESHGMDHSGTIRRPHLIEFSAYVVDGQLLIEWAYSEQVHERETIERLAQNYLAALRSLITFCLSTEETRFTPSDFSDFGWDQQDLDAILIKIDAF